MEAALKLTTYTGERERTGGRLLGDALLDVYARHRLRASVLLRGTVGFGRGHRLHTDRLLTLSEDLPLVTVAVDRRERIENVLDAVLALRPSGLVTLERAGLLASEPPPRPQSMAEATKLTLYLGRHERIGAEPAFVVACQTLQAHGVVGATVLLGVDGTRHGERRRAALLGRNAAVPLMLIALGEFEPIAAAVAELAPALIDPVLTIERVRVCSRDGRLLASPHALPGRDERGRPLWQKLMIHTTEAARHADRPLHLELVRRLRASDTAGATSLGGSGASTARPHPMETVSCHCAVTFPW